jgi:hypothetical protein
MFFKKADDEKIRMDFASELWKLIGRARASGVSGWDIENRLKSAQQQMTYERTMQTVA